MSRLRRYGAIAYLRDLYRTSSPSSKKHKSKRQPASGSSRSHHRSHRSYEQSAQPHYPSSTRYHSRHEHREREPPHASTRNRYAHITALPPELKHLIVSDLDPVTSACLGLASKDYYPIHRSHHRQRIDLYDQAEGRLPLAMYLREWAPKDMLLNPRSGRLSRREREYDGERARWERRLRRSKRYERMDVGGYRW